MYTHMLSLRMHHTDAAGIIYFGRAFEIFGDVFEAFFSSSGHAIGPMMRDSTLLLPVVHAEADYAIPMQLGDEVQVTVWVHAVGNTSFTLAYTIRLPDGRISCRGKTIHAVIDRTCNKAVPIPAKFRTFLDEAARQAPAEDAGTPHKR